MWKEELYIHRRWFFHFISSDGGGESRPSAHKEKRQVTTYYYFTYVWPSGRCYRLLVWLYNPTVDLSLLLFWPSALKIYAARTPKSRLDILIRAGKMIECRVCVLDRFISLTRRATPTFFFIPSNVWRWQNRNGRRRKKNNPNDPASVSVISFPSVAIAVLGTKKVERILYKQVVALPLLPICKHDVISIFLWCIHPYTRELIYFFLHTHHIRARSG